MVTKKQEHQLDIAVQCPAKKCLAKSGKECKSLNVGIVHFGRRLKRLMVEMNAKLNRSVGRL